MNAGASDGGSFVHSNLDWTSDISGVPGFSAYNSCPLRVIVDLTIITDLVVTVLYLLVENSISGLLRFLCLYPAKRKAKISRQNRI
jgi:hypothetical protein